MPSLTLLEIAELCAARIEGDANVVIHGPAGLAEAGPRDVSFLAHERFLPSLRETQAAAVLVDEDFDEALPGVNLLRCANPGRAFSRVIKAFAVPRPVPTPGIHASAVVDDSAVLGEGVSIGPFAVIGAGVELGAQVIVHAHVSIGDECRVGDQSELHPRVVLYPRISVGKRCILHAGAVIGADGFGFEPTEAGWDKTPQVGTVELGDDVEIGANTTVDRARFGSTRVGNQSKIDNLVHVAHNVQLGEACLLIAQCGIAGSTVLGRRVILAGQVGVVGHISIGDGVRAGGAAKLYRSVEPGLDMWGAPALPKNQGMRTYSSLPKVVEDVRDMRRRLKKLEGDQA